MIINWSINTFNYVDSLDGINKLQIRNIFNSMVSYMPQRFHEKSINNENVRICILSPLPFVVVFTLSSDNTLCTVLRVFHKKQILRL
ncbi:hypothetical protein [Clostridium sp.]|uniref:hypothetical protein n=1 Tax=Clostridium sp. TaxID=1506 RepID=UPI003D6C93AD